MSVDMNRAKEMRQQGFVFRDIAKELNCSESYLRLKLKGVAKGVKYEEKSVQEELKRISKELVNLVKRLEESAL